MDELDDRIDQEDAELRSRTRAWLEADSGAWLAWQFLDQLNNARGLLPSPPAATTVRQNDGTLIDWLTSNASGAYGRVYVHDDEDAVGHSAYGRGQADHTNELRVWRILNGRLDELADPFPSPIVPTINPNEPA